MDMWPGRRIVTEIMLKMGVKYRTINQSINQSSINSLPNAKFLTSQN